MNRTLLVSLFFLLTLQLTAQDDPFEQWNKNYKEIDLSELLEAEQYYADSIENTNADSLQFYFRADKYRFNCRFTGNWRKLKDERRSTMSAIFTMVGVDNSIADVIKKEVEIQTDFGNIWMPIQPQLEKPFKKEVKPNSGVYIYAFFLNSHSTAKGLSNIFLISEFTEPK